MATVVRPTMNFGDLTSFSQSAVLIHDTGQSAVSGKVQVCGSLLGVHDMTLYYTIKWNIQMVDVQYYTVFFENTNTSENTAKDIIY